MIQNSQPQIRSFRLTTRKKASIKSFSQQKAQSSSSEQSQFSSEYHMLTKRLKIKAKQISNNKLGSTVSSFCGLNSFRVRTESSYHRTPLGKVDTTQLFFANKKNQVGSAENLRYSTEVKQTGKLKFSTQNYKIRKNFKIQRPSIYWQMSQQSNEITLLNKKPQKQRKQQQLLISQQNSKSKQKFLQNCILLWNIRKPLTQKTNKIKPKDVIKSIKAYIMRKQQKEEPNSSIQKLFTSVDDQNDFKQIIACERIIIVGIVDLINMEKLHCVCTQSVNVLDNLIGFYRYVLGCTFTQSKFFQGKFGFAQSENLCAQIDAQDIEQKNSLTSTLLYLCTKYQTVYRYSPTLLKKVKTILTNAKKVSINRSFYDLLTIFAIHLNDQQSQKQPEHSYSSKYITSFIICPSPFIVEERKNRKYSLVIDLDETLVYTKFESGSAGGHKTQYRPHCAQFLTNLSKYYQIIIFTSSISSYAQQVISPFLNNISHILCREHTIKIKGQTIKDLSRIGRSLETTIIVDNLPENFKLQKENGILVKSWYGDKDDTELKRLEVMLMRIVGSNTQDVRKQLKLICGIGN